jgi:hypothetical protein
MIKVHILSTCTHCNGEAYLPCGEGEDADGRKYVRHIPCPMCDGSGMQPRWVSLQDLAIMLQQSLCTHEHTSFQGNMRFSAGDVLDDIAEVCNDCGAHLDKH